MTIQSQLTTQVIVSEIYNSEFKDKMRLPEPQTLLYSSFVYFLSHLSILSPYVEIDTNYGILRGVKSVSRSGRPYIEFLGIPYAKPPIGNLRFEPPEPPYKWKGVRDATNYANSCYQYEFLTHVFSGSEDCLHLNIYTHKVLRKEEIEKANLKPVIVFFYGGLFQSGYSYIYRGKYFLDEDVVLVTLNYRVSSFGFLNTQDGNIRGNMGLKDQVMALRYVQENIQYFGGDPNSVTIMGQSAGGASVQYHMLSTMSTGLFHRAISQSGGVLNIWSFSNQPRLQAERLAKGMGCSTVNSTEMVNCLKRKPAFDIATFHKEYLNPLPDPITIYSPSVEIVKDHRTFISQPPLELLQQGKIVNQVPWIVGVTNGEGLLGAAYLLKLPQRLADLDTQWNEIFPVILGYSNNSDKYNISARIRDFYFQNRSINSRVFPELGKMYSDTTIYLDMHDAIWLHAAKSSSPIYSYYFTYEGNLGLTNIMLRMVSGLPRYIDILIGSIRRWFLGKIDPHKIKEYGVSHADELAYMFNLPAVADEITPGSEDYPFSNALVKCWTSFAATGKPGYFLGKEWRPMEIYKNETLSFFEIGNFPKIILEPFKKSVDFYRSLKLKL